MAVKRIAYPEDFIGLSTDTKPTNVTVGSTFYETDTTAAYIWDGSAWQPL